MGDYASCFRTMASIIALEGVDGSGKTTQLKTLAKTLRLDGYSVLETAEPSKGSVGNLLREELSHQSMSTDALSLLFAADRVDHQEREILPALLSGKIILVDRHILSSLVYQRNNSQGVDWLKRINQAALWPGLTLFIKVSPRVAWSRIWTRDHLDENETLDNLLNLVALYDTAIAELNRENIVVIDGDQSKNDVTKEILSIIEPYLTSCTVSRYGETVY